MRVPLLFAGTLLSAAFAADATITERLDEVLADLIAAGTPTGILYDRVLPLSSIEDFDGSPPPRPATPAAWRQVYNEIYRASLAPPSWPPLTAVLAQSRTTLAAGAIPLAIMNFRYDRIRTEAMDDGSLAPGDGQLLSTGLANPLETRRVFAAAPLRDGTYQGSAVVFRCDPTEYFTNDPAAVRTLEVDFGDGSGFIPMAFGSGQAVRYATPGRKTIRLRLACDADLQLDTAFYFDVHALRTPAPHDTLHIQATIPYQGALGSGEAYVYLAEDHTALTEPVILLEGFDLDNSMNWDELYALLNREDLIEELRSRGFDAVVLNFTDAVDFIQRNAFVAVELIQQVRALVGPGQSLPLVGASMGGLVGRYALAYMETHGMDHSVRSFISFDSPQAGADIPLGLQYWLWFFASESPEAAALLAALDSPAARQLLVYHYTDPPGATGVSDPLRAQLMDDLAAVGDYPGAPRRVSFANGSGAQAGQGFLPGDQVIEWEYSSILVDIVGNVWSVPEGSSQAIFHGLIDIILLPADEEYVTVSGTLPYDNAPGGWRGSMAQLDSTQAPYGDILALHDNHCFIPSISALAIETGDLFYDIAGDPNLLDHTPFDAVYFPLENEEHVTITPQNAEWFIAEIEYGASAAVEWPPTAPRMARIELVAPHPVAGPSRIAFTTPHAGPIKLLLCDAAGRAVAVLAERHVAAGAGEFSWVDDPRVGPGIYFLRLGGSGFAASRKVVVR